MPICTGFPQLLLLSYILTRKELEKNKRNLFELFFCKGKYYNYIHTYVYSDLSCGAERSLIDKVLKISSIFGAFLENMNFTVLEIFQQDFCRKAIILVNPTIVEIF